MLSPSQGFLFCLPVRLGALVVSVLAFVGSGILSGFTFRSLATVSSHITPVQTAGFYLTSVSWISLSLFSLLGFISVILQHPLLLTIFARFVVYHLPANFACNLFFTIVLFVSYRDADAVLRSPQCHRGSLSTPVCSASASLQTLTWLYLFILLPALVAQTYIYVIVKRFIFVINGEWDLEQEHALEAQSRTLHTDSDKPASRDRDRKRRTTITQSIGHGGRRRAKAQLWFTMETAPPPPPPHPTLEADESFLPSMLLSPMAFQSPSKTQFTSIRSGLPSSPLPSFKLGHKPSKPSLRVDNLKDETSDRSARLDMDFSDPEPVVHSPRSGEWLKPSPDKGKGKEKERSTRESDASVYSIESLHASSSRDGLL